jgi:prophage maintenance system killer protein
LAEYLDLADYLLIAESVAYLALVEFLARNDIEWRPPSTDETVSAIEGVAAGEVSEQELGEWLRRTRP